MEFSLKKILCFFVLSSCWEVWGVGWVGKGGNVVFFYLLFFLGGGGFRAEKKGGGLFCSSGNGKEGWFGTDGEGEKGEEVFFFDTFSRARLFWTFVIELEYGENS